MTSIKPEPHQLRFEGRLVGSRTSYPGLQRRSRARDATLCLLLAAALILLSLLFVLLLSSMPDPVHVCHGLPSGLAFSPYFSRLPLRSARVTLPSAVMAYRGLKDWNTMPMRWAAHVFDDGRSGDRACRWPSTNDAAGGRSLSPLAVEAAAGTTCPSPDGARSTNTSSRSAITAEVDAPQDVKGGRKCLWMARRVRRLSVHLSSCGVPVRVARMCPSTPYPAGSPPSRPSRRLLAGPVTTSRDIRAKSVRPFFIASREGIRSSARTRVALGHRRGQWARCRSSSRSARELPGSFLDAAKTRWLLIACPARARMRGPRRTPGRRVRLVVVDLHREGPFSAPLAFENRLVGVPLF